MKKNKKILKSVSASAVSALMILSLGFSASAAVIDEEETASAPPVTLAQSKSGEPVGAESLPSYYSSLDLGYVTEVKRQLYNDCWVYGALATYESLLLRNGISTESMSPDHANIWGSTREDNKGWIRKYYDAGRAKIMPGYFTSWQGGVEMSKVAGLDLISTAPEMLATDLAGYGVTSIKYLYKENPDSIKQAIMESGGVSGYYSNVTSCLSKDQKSYYVPPTYSGGYAGHAIEVVGWDDNYSKENFNTLPQNDGAWLIKNSWGTSYNDKGYFWISYEDRDIFNDSKYKPTYQIKSFEPIDSSKKLLQNEIYGATYEFSYINDTELTAFESFDFDSNFRTLDKVIFETYCQGANYTVYYVPEKDGAPNPDSSKWTELYSSTVEFPGYICADFEDFEVPDASGSVAVKIDASPINTNATLGVGEWLSTNNSEFVFVNDSKPGDSYISFNGKIMDALDWYKTYNNDDIGGTFVIKAITKKSAPKQGDVNLDGVVDVNDAYLLQKHIALLIELDDEALSVADMNGDGFITISDVTIIQRIAAGIEV